MSDVLTKAMPTTWGLLVSILPIFAFAQASPPIPPPSPGTILDTIVVQGQKLSVETKIDRKI